MESFATVGHLHQELLVVHGLFLTVLLAISLVQQ